MASLTLEPGPDGKRRRHVFYGRSRREVLAKLDKARNDLIGGIKPLTVADRRTTVGQLLDEWLSVSDAQAKQRALTRGQYLVAARTRIVRHLGPLPIIALDADRIERWQVELLALGYAPRSIWKARVVLSAIIRLARRRKLLRDNPLELVDAPPADLPDKRAITGEQVTRLFRAIRGHRFETLLMAGLLTGARRGELLGWAWADVDLDAGMVRMRQQVQRIPRAEGLQLVSPKTAASNRHVPLPSFLVERLLIHRAEQLRMRDQVLAAGGQWANTDPETGGEMLVFTTTTGTLIEPRNFNRVFKALVEEAGLSPLTPHELRHSMSTILMALGVPPVVVSQILGHADPSVTLRWYNHVVPEAHREAMERMDEYIRRLAGESATQMAVK